MLFSRSPSVARISQLCRTTRFVTSTTRLASILSISRSNHDDRAFSSSRARGYTATSHALNLKDFQEHWAKQADIWASRARPPSDHRPIDVTPPSSKPLAPRIYTFATTQRSEPTTSTAKTSTIATTPRIDPTTPGPRPSSLSAKRPP